MFASTICSFPFTQVLLRSNGDLFFCNHQKQSFGNLFESNFDDLWFGDTADEIRLSLTNQKFHINCQVFDCPFHEKILNKIEYSEYPVVLIIDNDEKTADLIPKLNHLSLIKLVLLNPYEFSLRLNFESIEAVTLDYLNVLQWLEFPKSKITFCIDYVGSKLTDLYEFSQKRNKSQKLVVKHFVKDLNTHANLGIVHIAKDTKADYVEFETSMVVNQENCGLLFKLQQEIIAECEKLQVPCRCPPLDKGLYSSVIL